MSFYYGELTEETLGYRMMAVWMPKMEHEYLNYITNLRFNKSKVLKVGDF